MKKYWQILACVALTATMAACAGKNDGQTGTTTEEEKPKVKLAAASTRKVEQIGEYTATVESDVKNNISSNTALRIERIFAEVGDQVRKGQTLVQLDASNLRQLQLQIENQRVEFNRIDQLYKVGGASKAEWDNAKMQLEVNETLYANKEENTRLTSPIDGVVTARNYDNGDMTGNAPILTVESLSPVKMLIHVSETYYPQVVKGMAAEVRLDVYTGETFAGRVSLVYPTVDANTHTFPVEITLTEGGQRVRPGMFARATLNFGAEERIVIPDESVVKQMGAGDYYVYVYENGRVSRKKVALGRRLGDEYEVVSGLPSGVRVVIAGQKSLADGVAVDVVK